MARGLYIGGKIGWESVPPIDLLTGVSQQIDLSAYLYNPRSRVVTYSAVGSLPAGCSISGSSFNWNGAGTVSTTGITLRAESSQYQVDTTATVDIASGANVGPEWDQYIGPFSVASSATVGTVVATMSDYVSDPENDPLVITMNGSLPSGLSYDADTTEITVTGALTAGASSSVTFDADDAYTSAQADWVARSTATGVIQAFDFRDAADVSYPATGGRGVATVPANVSRYTGDGVTGGACLRIDIPASSGTDPGSWKCFLSSAWNALDITTPQYGVGLNTTAFYVQYRLKFDENWLVLASGSGGEGKKASIVSTAFTSNEPFEHVIQDIQALNIVRAYHQDGSSFVQFSSTVGGQISYQNQVGVDPPTGDYCHYGTGPTYPNCYRFTPNVWMCFLQRIEVPTYGGSSGNKYDLWAWKPGETGYTHLMSHTNYTVGSKGAYTQGFNGLWLTPYTSGRTSSTVNSYALYDQVIVSTSAIAVPTV